MHYFMILSNFLTAPSFFFFYLSSLRHTTHIHHPWESVVQFRCIHTVLTRIFLFWKVSRYRIESKSQRVKIEINKKKLMSSEDQSEPCGASGVICAHLCAMFCFETCCACWVPQDVSARMSLVSCFNHVA